MYRILIPVLVYAIAATAAPQNGGSESEITYVKIQPVTDRNNQAKSLYRESRIENIPLTIPGVVTDEKLEDNVQNPADVQESGKSTEIGGNIPKDDANIPKDDSNIPEDDANTREDDVRGQNENKRRSRSEDTTASYEADTIEPTGVTESVEELIQQTEEYETRTKAPRYLSKLSYFKKDDGVVRSSIATNLLERVGKRQYKTKCRCGKIWNCPKLQITVGRCPNEYFLCCF